MPQSPALPHIGPFVTHYDGREIVHWEDPRSLFWLSRTHANKSFQKLSRFFEAQSDKFMCGPASLAMTLNAIHMDSEKELPIDHEHESYPRSQNPELPDDFHASFARYTQRNIFEKCLGTKTLAEVYGTPNADGVSVPGLNLLEMQDICKANGVRAKVVHVMDDAPQFHEDIFMHALTSENTYIIANFDRRVWGLKGGGHIAPIGALDMILRKVLILDVNMCGKWLWIDFDLMVKSMASFDHNSPRGYLIISP